MTMWLPAARSRVASLAVSVALALMPLAVNADQLHATSRETASVSVPASHADRTNAVSRETAAVSKPSTRHDGGLLQGRYTMVVNAPDGRELFREDFHNLVTTQGKNAMLDTFLGRGSAYAAIYFGLITSNTAPVAGDTYASHGFSEAGTSVISARLAPTYGAASGGTKATSSGTTFTLNAAATIYGLMQVLGPAGTSAAGDTATSGAILYSAGLFSSSIAVPSGSTVTVNYSGSL